MDENRADKRADKVAEPEKDNNKSNRDYNVKGYNYIDGGSRGTGRGYGGINPMTVISVVILIIMLGVMFFLTDSKNKSDAARLQSIQDEQVKEHKKQAAADIWTWQLKETLI